MHSVLETEVNKYEEQYFKELDLIKTSLPKMEYKYVQPKNKKETCKVYVVGYISGQDRTLNQDYELFWDGDCKDGYAHGLGREFENTMDINMEQIGYYEKGKATDYCVWFDSIRNIYQEGKCGYEKDAYYIETIINDKMNEFDIGYTAYFVDLQNRVSYSFWTSPFSLNIVLTKVYPNFSYRIENYSANEFVQENFIVKILNMNGKENGFSYILYKNGQVVAGEVENNQLLRQVQLPKSYYDKIQNVYEEILTKSDIAFKAKKQAEVIKEKYKKKICKKSVIVNFMDNEDYKEICKEEEKFAKIQSKINEKVSTIRDRISQERLINARELEAAAAMGQARAFQDLANEAYRSNINQSIQNMRKNQQIHYLYIH